MNLMYQSTRGGEKNVTASQAILKGLADDGGLFMPVEIPALDLSMELFADMSYQETAYEVMKRFFTDFTEEELKECINKAYDSKFDTEEIAPLSKADGMYFLELYHGNTIAFKDMALSILPHLMTTSAKKNHADKKIVILTATSGDTGKAAMAGFADVEGTEIIVFYPKGGVSRIQELQMLTQKGENTHVVAIHGNFDDAQTGVKKIFGDREFGNALAERGYQLSSANSINIGRLVPQVVYYVYAYAKLLKNSEIEKNEKINVTVPTGNFGNILAAYFAKQMGVPIDKLICASNDNKVLYDFFTTGTYDKNREFILTSSPSMDILVSSNLERLIYLSAGCDADKTRGLMEELSREGKYAITDEMKARIADFRGGYATQAEDEAAIAGLFKDTGYVIDTHTGVAAAVYQNYMKETGDMTKTVIASTASPYKFSRSVVQAMGYQSENEGGLDVLSEFEIVDELNRMSGMAVPEAVEEIRFAIIRHDNECDVDKMEEMVSGLLK
ncbi:threonine synthase [Clostridium sp. AM58-1XD]|uniref:threonine synthase n=1 Tax=Clostridium sp. AM58-1XD TaxID=2292307 RepID=UPI000E4C63FE|nr:threonine synthase [Clostridium sp. AM58-1XD]RGY95172.1 threonine synthase [Clostridium sp. AM58-1XD]